jgi:hypothetical protein
MQGYLILGSIIGGQTLASASPHLNATTGIVITSLISLAVSLVPGHLFFHWHIRLAPHNA